ncbi:MAG: GIY-YIG nuclease family protein [Patescibacteria group bacterium]|nr:GIY-YIG nuclease family protein [Patescibacteria group bacterium]MDE2590187.1 GIY-YIG nuclease family protein [Patescibacteria group bacterium]
MLPQSLVFVDTETTGLSPLRDRIIEIGLLRIENGKVVDTYQTLINPQMYISPLIENLTGITKEALETAPIFEDVARKIYALLDEAVFVAHNVRFDYAFLKNEFKRFEKSFSPKQFCTAKLSRTLFPQHRHHNLDSIIERFGFTVAHRHRAFDDAKVLWEFYQVISEKFTEETLANAINQCMKRVSLPQGISPQTVSNLPQSPGVYIFYGENGVPLYVGKSVNIKDRVLSHFSSDHSSGKEMRLSQQVKHIETIQTCGELGALIKESQLVKQLQPLYNRKLRISRKLIKLTRKVNGDGYETVEMKTVDGILPKDIPDIVGIFKSQQQAKHFLIDLAKEYDLCEKLVGLEKTKGACFAYRLNQCKGACVKNESPVSYNFRFISAFSKYKMRAWPFSGPVEITEKNNTQAETFVIENWCLVGHKTYDEQLDTDHGVTPLFDLDMYKILVGFIHKAKPSALNFSSNVS